METVIDWSKAPKWATAVGKASASLAWICDSGYCFQGIHNPPCHPFKENSYSLEDFTVVELRPWDGTGLPPAGTVCEIKGCMSHYLQWNKVTVFAVRGKTILFDMEDGRWGSTTSHEIRPLRTPEQIAAEEREKSVKEMLSAVNDLASGARLVAEDLYDAGYRKQVQP